MEGEKVDGKSDIEDYNAYIKAKTHPKIDTETPPEIAHLGLPRPLPKHHLDPHHEHQQHPDELDTNFIQRGRNGKIHISKLTGPGVKEYTYKHHPSL